MKQLFIIGLFFTLTFLMRPALSADLSSNIMKRVNWANQYLDEAEGQIASGRAEFAGKNIKGAREEYGNISKYYGGSYDSAHPTLTTLQERIKTVADNVKNSLAAPQVSKPEPKTTTIAAPVTTAKPAKTSTAAPTVSDPLPASMIQHMYTINPGVDSLLEHLDTMLNKRINTGAIKEARSKHSFNEHYWATKKQQSKGKFHPQHPDVLALNAKMARVEKKLSQMDARADEEKSKLAGILPIIQQNAKRLEEAYENAQWKVRAIESAISDTKGNKSNKLLAAMEKAREPVERVNALLPAARQAVTDFRRQFPDNKALQKLIGYDSESKVRSAVEKVERFPKDWLEMNVGRTVKSALDSAESNIKEYGSDHLVGLEGKVHAQKEYAANSSQKFVVILSSTLLETIDVLLPELPESDKAALPEFVKARKQALDRVTPMRADIVKTETAVRKVLKDVLDSKHRKLAAARFPPRSEYHGGKWDDAEKVIRNAFKASIHDKELLKIDIYRPWEVREEAKWRHDYWEINTYRYIGANCLAKLNSGMYRVYRMNFRNTKLADGSWSTLELWSVGHVYEILQENIDK